MKRVVVFLHEDTAVERGMFDSCNEYFTTVEKKPFRYFLSPSHDIVFSYAWVKEGDKNTLRNVISAAESKKTSTSISDAWMPVKGVINDLITTLRQLGTLCGDEQLRVIIFIHWHDTSGFQNLRSISDTFNTFLQSQNGSVEWLSRPVSSEMHTQFNDFIFDVKKPIIPVADFDKWFEMYEEWWKGNGVLPKGYKFVDHKTLGGKKGGGCPMGGAQSGRSQEGNADDQNNSVEEIKSMFEKTAECKTGASWIGICLLVIATILVVALCLSFSFGLLPLRTVPLLITDRLLLMFSINCLGVAIIMVFSALISSLHNRIRRKEILYGGELNVLMKNIARMPDSQAKYKAVNRVMEKVEKITFGSMVRD